MIAIIAEAENDYYARVEVMLQQSHGRMESVGIGQPHRLTCDYCGQMRDRADLELAGLGVFMCKQCREQIDAALKSKVFSFWQLLDFVLLRPASAASGAPVAVSVCLAPFSGLTHPGEGKPWWQGTGFWGGGRQATISWFSEKLFGPDSHHEL